MKRIADFFIFTSLFIALCAVVMVWQTHYLFHVAPTFRLYGFVFAGSVCSYNLHWYLTPPNAAKQSEKLYWNVSNKQTHLILFLLGAIGSAVFSFLLLDHWFWLGLTALFTFLYTAPKIPWPIFSYLKKVAVGKTIFLALAWAHITSFLPVVVMEKSVNAGHILFLANRFFFIYSICILFDYRDVEEDRRDGIKSLITLLSEKGIDRLFWFSIFVFAITDFFLIRYFSATQVLILFIPGIIVAALYYPAKKNFSDYLYYFVLDGLMMLSGLLFLVVALLQKI